MRNIILLLALASFSFAQPLSLGTPNKEEAVHSSWLNMGLGIGVLSPTSSEFKEQSKAFVNPAFLIGIQFAELSALTFEVDLITPKGGAGVWFGFEQQFIQRQITPFAEAQLGARSPGENDVGVGGSLNAGVIFFRESQFRIRLKGGYECIFNKTKDKAWNAEGGVLFAVGRAGLKTIRTD
ncbi:MAG: hypothetical protein LBC87_07115 [Fibromonadaceae bacterium]|jgi:hypothetical protein|nr:hypothetical protein [Fibromonadaceae bacterium]